MPTLAANLLADVNKYSPDQPRDDHGRFGSGGGSKSSSTNPHEMRQHLKDNGFKKTGTSNALARHTTMHSKELGDRKVVVRVESGLKSGKYSAEGKFKDTLLHGRVFHIATGQKYGVGDTRFSNMKELKDAIQHESSRPVAKV